VRSGRRNCVHSSRNFPGLRRFTSARIRMPDCPIPCSDGLSRNAGDARAAASRMGAERLAEHRRRLLRHHAAHIKAIADAVRGVPPRQVPTVEPALRLSGLDALTIREHTRPACPALRLARLIRRCFPRGAGKPTRGECAPSINFLNIGERTNVAGSPKFAQLIKPAITRRRSPSPASRSRTARRSLTSAWTRND